MSSKEHYFEEGIKAKTQRKHEEAINFFTKAISLDEEYVEAFIHRGDIYKRLGQLDKAREDYLKVQSSPKALEKDKLLCSAFLHEIDQNFVKTEKEELIHYYEAIKCYTKMIELDLKDEEAYCNRSILYNKLGLYYEAIEDATAGIISIKLSGKPDFQLARIYASRAMSYVLLGNLNRADIDCKMSLDISPKQPRANFILACLLEQKQEHEKAITQFQRYLELGHFDKELTNDAIKAINRLKSIQDDFEKRDKGSSTKEEIDYDFFLSHYQRTGGLLAMTIKLLLLRKNAKLRIFLDVDDLENIHNLKANVERTQVLLLLLTEGVFERKFVLEEIRAALEFKKKIVLIWDKERCGFPDISTIPEDLREVLLIRAIIWQAEKSFRKVVINDIMKTLSVRKFGVSKEVGVQTKILLIEPEVEKKIITVTSDITVEQLKVQIGGILNWKEQSIPSMKLKFWDDEFEEFIDITNMNHLPPKAKIRVGL